MTLLYEAAILVTAAAAMFGATHYLARRGWMGCVGMLAVYVLYTAVLRSLKHHVDVSLLLLLWLCMVAAGVTGFAVGSRRREEEAEEGGRRP